MKILMLNYEFPPIGGGAGQAHLNLLGEYAKRPDLQIDVLTAAPRPDFTLEQFADNIRLHRIGLHKKSLHYWTKIEILEWLWKANRYYKRLISREKYDLVHSFFAFPPGWLCYRTRDRLPYILSLRGSDVPGFNVRLRLDYKLLAGLFRRIWAGASAIVANSRGLRQLAKDFMPELDIDVIPNGVDTAIYRPALQKRSDGPIRLLSVGRLITRKRTDWLIDVVHAAAARGLNVHLTIAGEGNLLAQLQEKTRKMNLSDRIAFLGRVEPERMPEVYRDNDIFVMASEHEGMSNAMLEAIASGLPVISTACEGVEELINDNGILVTYPHVYGFVAAIRSITAVPDKYETLSKASRAIAETFSWSAVADKYIEHYRQILNPNI
ncbi:MAG: glycosyltransferase family 4 protein [Planctomycetaceae bacterium]|nr:glycosyltransferase family 4 protein [Planctomycetaceae bacterium]